MLRSSGLSTMLVAAGVLAACQGRAEKGGGDWNRFASGFIETYFKANPLFASYQGRHEYDGLFPDWSEAGLKRWMGRLHQLRDSAAAFPIDSSNASARFERDYLIAVIDRDLFWGERADQPHRNPEFYTAWMDPNVYLAREYAPLPVRMRAFTKYATNLPAALAQARTNLRTPLPKAYARIGKGRIAGLAEYLEGSVPAVFASVRDTTLQRRFATANAGAAKALRELSAWFGVQRTKAFLTAAATCFTLMSP